MTKKEPADKVLNRAAKAAKARDWEKAAAAYGEVLARFPANKRARKGLSAIAATALPDLFEKTRQARGKGQLEEAERSLTVAHTIAPELTEVTLALGYCQWDRRRAPAALATARKVLTSDPSHTDALNLAGRALSFLGRANEAREHFERTLQQVPNDVQTLENLGVLAIAQGEADAARAHFERALEIAPSNASLHKNLARVTRYTPDTPHLGTLRALTGSSKFAGSEKAGLHFALFKALDECGDTAEAFASLRRGNELVHAAQSYDLDKTIALAQLARSLVSEPVQLQPTERPAFRPVFITGLPRSGTTLVERIIGRSTQVQACGELPVVQDAVNGLLRDVLNRPDRALTETDIPRLRATILAELGAYADGSPILIDKLPLNFRWIGLICAALPEARVVHVTRDAMANAWSLYRQNFDGRGNGFAYDMGDIARFMAFERGSARQWQETYPQQVHLLSYEELVDNPETETQALAKALDMTWSEDWITPEKASGPVLTASSIQVRQPIYRDSNEGWTRYRDQLPKMENSLKAFGLV